MTKTKFYKIFAFINFAFLITLFLIYKGGLYEKRSVVGGRNSFASHNGGSSGNCITDTILPKRDTVPNHRLSSSKSMLIVPDFNFKDLKFGKDSAIKKLDTVKVELK